MGCPKDCDWEEWGDLGESCPLHTEGTHPKVKQLILTPTVALDADVDTEPEVVVFSLEGAKAAVPGSPTCPARRLISILCHGEPPVGFKPGWDDVLDVRFDDVVAAFQVNDGARVRQAVPISDEQAEAIVDFVLKAPDAPIAVHCAAGISRSVATAAFISRVLGHRMVLRGGSATESTGNPTVYRRLLTAYFRREGLGDVLEDVNGRGIPHVFDTPILQRVVRVESKFEGAALPPLPRHIRPRPLIRWGLAESKLSEPWRTRSRKLRLRLILKVINPVGRFLHRHGLAVTLGEVADGLWLVWRGVWSLISDLSERLSGR